MTDKKEKYDSSDKKKPVEKVESIPFRRLFRFADRKEKLFMIVGSISALINGVAMPLISIVFGDISNDFIGSDDIIKTAGRYSLYFTLIGLGSFLFSYLSFGFWTIVGESIGIKYRKAYFKSLIKQEIGFYDTINPNEIASRVSTECHEIQEGIGQKVSSYLYALAMTLVGFLIGYIKGWQLALVLTACVPCMGIAGAIFITSFQKIQRVLNEAYAKAGAVAEESLNAIRTVTALCGQPRETKRYRDLLVEASKKIFKFMVGAGLAMGSLTFFMTATWALGFYFGSKLIENSTTNPLTGKTYNVGDVLTVFFAILIGSSSIPQLAPCLKAFASAKESAVKAFKIIDKKSLIDIDDPKGIKPTKVDGEFTFEKVEFAYPMKKEKTVLKGISFTIKKNQKTALVGESGCGKTTSMQLIERFYDVTGGSIKLDGNDIRDLNLLWLRSQIGYVGQEPVLFATSIKENLLFAKENATDAEIWEALKKANAYDFVQNLPKKLDTFVGTSGTQLSGGQKQRLAIARAILKNPPILLLDEATSALDRKNEREIQQTLDEISGGRTTIVIAHRLSTIQNADHIVVFDNGVIVEEGTHQELVAKKGKYYTLQYLQLAQNQEGDQDKKDAVEEIKPDTKDKDTKPAERKKSDHNVAIASTTSVPEKEKPKDPEQEKLRKKKVSNAVRRLITTYTKGQRLLLFCGLVMAAINGVLFPFLSLFLSNMLGVLAQPNLPSFRDEANRYCLYFLIDAIVGFVVQTLSMAAFTRYGDKLTFKLRTDMFAKLLKMPIGWYDNPHNSPGGLTTKLATDCQQINTLAGSTFAIMVQALSNLITGLAIAFTSSWEITLCTIGFLPVLVFAGKIQAKVSQGYSAKTEDAYKESGAFIAEAVVNMRTVASFGREDNLIKSFEEKLQSPLKSSIRKGNMTGLAFGFSQFTTFANYAFLFIVSAALMKAGRVEYSEMFRAIFSIMFAAIGMGQAFQYLPDIGAAQNSAVELFELLDYKPEIDIDDPNQTLKAQIKGEVEFRNIWFKYPTREKQVLKNFNLKINTNSKIALVGPSGCGKSTLIGLLLRFYDPQQGEILVDGVDIKKYDLQHLRRSLGYVSQEPTLFNDTIESNIKYTKLDATDQEIRQAASEANCLKFIEANQFEALDLDPDAAIKYGTGFKRIVGPKGSQISGGQKQRIAIARAILPKPHILLLDEATSALDAENEKVVQESLDTIMHGKTSIVVAHRISTIKDADQILVFNDGAVVEKGNYEELTKLQGYFYRLERGLAH